MKSKSIVQERLEASKNRLEVLIREVENNRITVPNLTTGLRQVGTYLEAMQRMVKSDTNVKFKAQLDSRLENGINRLSNTIHALEGVGITGSNLSASLVQTNRTLDSFQELLELEIEDLR